MIAAHEWREALGLVADFLAAWQPRATTAGLGLFLAWSWWARRRRSKVIRKLREEVAAIRADVDQAIAAAGERGGAAQETIRAALSGWEAQLAALKGEVHGEHAGEGARPGILRRLARIEEGYVTQECLAAVAAARPTKEALEQRVSGLIDYFDAEAKLKDGKAEVDIAAMIERCEALELRVKGLDDNMFRQLTEALREERNAAALQVDCKSGAAVLVSRVDGQWVVQA